MDTASRTGWAVGKVDKEDVVFDCGFIDVDTKELFFKYNQLIESFKGLINPKKGENYRIIIEDTFFGRNVNSLKLISRIGMIAYVIAYFKGIKDIRFIYPTSSRKALGIKGTLKKKEVHEAFAQLTGIRLEDEDIVDGIILSLNGLLEEETLV